MPTRDVEEDREQRSPLGLFRQVAPQNRQLEETPISTNKPRGLGDKADEMQRQEVGLVDDRVELERPRTIEVEPVELANQFGNN
jgi:hypothetical protein